MSTEALEIGVITDTHSAFQGSLNGDIVFGLGDYCGKGEANKIIGNYDKYLLITGNHDDFSYPITNLSKDEYTILKLPETAELRKTPESCVITSIYDNIYLMLTHEPPTKKQIFYVIESLDIKNSNLISLSGHTHKKNIN
ncbi:MAG: metallophosphoesterase family protein [Nitrososphaerota archaeon]